MLITIAAFLATQAVAATSTGAEPPRVEAQTPPAASAANAKSEPKEPTKPIFTPNEVRSTGSVTVGGRRIAYQAVAGTLVVHAKDWDDTEALEDVATPDKKKEDEDDKPKAEASMFYTAYFKNGAPAANRPITFLFNGGPGSSTVWLHMGAFGPRRVVTADQRHTPAAPYTVVNNDQSLLDASDLVFIDAPGTGFSRIAGKDKEKSFYGVDQDIDAFTQFITQFLSKYGRWNSPKYVFGESYGTMRGAGLALALQNKDVDLNGLILLSDILNWDLLPDDPQINPGIDLPYVVALPTYAATAWYHNRVANRPADLQIFLAEIEAFATGEYAQALIKGNDLGADERQRVAAKLAGYTGLPVAYLLKTNLRVEYGAFQKELLAEQDTTVGTLDTRFIGATLDPLSKVASYDPQSAAISAAYVGAFNDYVRGTLRYGDGTEFKSGIQIYSKWDYKHQPPTADKPLIALPNVLPDLAVAMKTNPDLKVMVNGGYYDVSTPYFAGKFEMRHLPVPANILSNVEYHYYESGHMVYAHQPSLVAIHNNVADFIRRTSGTR
jgi:carboxypeptidase C (cathepsin A)